MSVALESLEISKRSARYGKRRHLTLLQSRMRIKWKRSSTSTAFVCRKTARKCDKMPKTGADVKSNHQFLVGKRDSIKIGEFASTQKLAFMRDDGENSNSTHLLSV
jgi:hypothetical protein